MFTLRPLRLRHFIFSEEGPENGFGEKGCACRVSVPPAGTAFSLEIPTCAIERWVFPS